MAEAIDPHDAATAMQSLRVPLSAAVSGAVASLTAQGLADQQARAWAAGELLAVVVDALAMVLPNAPDGEPLDERAPFDMNATARHLQIEREIAAEADRLRATGLCEAEAIMQAAALALQSLAGILAGTARPARHVGG